MPVDPIDLRLGANLRRVILENGYSTIQAFHANNQCPFTLDYLYKRIRGVHSLRVRDVIALADVLGVDPAWLSKQIVEKAGDRDQFVAGLVKIYKISPEEIEGRLQVHLQNMNWRQVERLIELGQITL